MRKLAALIGLTYIMGAFASTRGMGTINQSPLRYAHPYRYEGYSGLKGPAGRFLNQRQKRKRARQVA